MQKLHFCSFAVLPFCVLCVLHVFLCDKNLIKKIKADLYFAEFRNFYRKETHSPSSVFSQGKIADS